MSANAEQAQVRCAVYTRKSTDENLDLDFNSLDAKREAAEAYVASQRGEGWTCLPDRYDDGGFSGGNTDRPAFRRLMADVERGVVDCIVVYKIDRLSRSITDFARIMTVLERHEVGLVSVTQQFNTRTSMGRLMLNVLLSFAQFEREIISERTRDKMGAARRKGKWTGGPPTLGYDILRDKRGSRLVVNEDEAERVRGIFRTYIEQGSMMSTLEVLRSRGWRTKRYETLKGVSRGGAEFSKSSLQKVLTNVLYLGKVSYKGDVFDGEQEAIIDEELFNRAQGLMRRNRNSGGKYVRNKHGALLKGLVACKHCGCVMIHHFASKGNARYRYYVCGHAQKKGWNTCPYPSLPAPELEAFVIDQIKEVGKDPAVLGECLDATQAHLRAEIEALEAERGEVEARVRALSREMGEIAPRVGYDEKASRQSERLQERMGDEQRAVGRLNGRIEKIRRRMLNQDELAGAVEAFDPLWDSLSPTHKARLVHLLVDRVEYDGENETLSITFHPTGIGDEEEEEALCSASGR